MFAKLRYENQTSSAADFRRKERRRKRGYTQYTIGGSAQSAGFAAKFALGNTVLPTLTVGNVIVTQSLRRYRQQRAKPKMLYKSCALIKQGQTTFRLQIENTVHRQEGAYERKQIFGSPSLRSDLSPYDY